MSSRPSEAEILKKLGEVWKELYLIKSHEEEEMSDNHRVRLSSFKRNEAFQMHQTVEVVLSDVHCFSRHRRKAFVRPQVIAVKNAFSQFDFEK